MYSSGDCRLNTYAVIIQFLNLLSDLLLGRKLPILSSDEDGTFDSWTSSVLKENG
jgi:hypothetical protein